MDAQDITQTLVGIGAIIAGLGYSWGQFKGGSRKAVSEAIQQHNLEREDWKGQREGMQAELVKLKDANLKLTSDLRDTTAKLATLESYITLSAVPPAIVSLHNESTRLILEQIAKLEESFIQASQTHSDYLKDIAHHLEQAGKK